MEEIYKTIVEFENYEVSNFGNVRNIKRLKCFKQSHDKDGYLIVTLSSSGKPTTKKVHRLVASAFLDNPERKTCIDHIDNNVANNNVLNLRFATHKENSYNQKIAKNNTSGTKGVYLNKHNTWCSQIYIDGIRVHLGSYVNKEDAIQARIIKANQVFGIFTNSCEKINEI